MNGKERLASAVLIATLTIGLVADVVHRRRMDNTVRRAESEGTSSPSDSSESTFRRLDINSANADKLTALPGIGPKKADAIVAWRRANGPFRSTECLLNVKGIGPKTLTRIEPYIVAGGETETRSQ